MSRLLVITRPALVPGFHLAGVEAFGAEDSGAATRLIDGWLEAGEAGLLAIDEALLDGLDAAFRRRLDSASRLPYLALPGGEPAGQAGSPQAQMAELMRRAIGVHITFKGGTVA
jgi:vacuolar-type H+-ATPase subunit F/Vma7